MASNFPSWPLLHDVGVAERNLILVHTEGFQSLSDFQCIRDFIGEGSPDIEVFIADNDSRCSVTRRGPRVARRSYFRQSV